MCVSYPLCSSGRSWELEVPLNWEVQCPGRVWVAEFVSHFPAASMGLLSQSLDVQLSFNWFLNSSQRGFICM